MIKIININKEIIGADTVNSVNARDLWEKLEIKQEFANWIKAQINSLGLEENIDYVRFDKKVNRQILKEYITTLDTAKHISMSSRTLKGKEVRNYFIEVEKGTQKMSTLDNNLSKKELFIKDYLANTEFSKILLDTLGKSATRKLYLKFLDNDETKKIIAKKTNPYKNDEIFILLNEKINNKDIEFFSSLFDKLILGIENQKATLSLEKKLSIYTNEQLSSFFLRELNQGVFTNETLKWFSNIYEIKSIGNFGQFGLFWNNIFKSDSKITILNQNKKINMRIKLLEFNSLTTSKIYLKDMVCTLKLGTKTTLSVEKNEYKELIRKSFVSGQYTKI